MMRPKQENAGATSARRMEIGAGGRRGDGSRARRARRRDGLGRCPELCLSPTEAHALLRLIVFEVNSIYSTFRSLRPPRLCPSPRHPPLSSFSWLPAFSPPIADHRHQVSTCHLCPTASTILPVGHLHYVPLPQINV
uniref:Uncharacterized protein n=1 Tax=Oryza punctata TaxID=4537 RepID=A0A0E0M059_ORYPU